MNETTKQKIHNYSQYLRNKLLNAGCDRAYVNSLSDTAILDDFRKCADCGEEIVTKVQQLRAILEFDTPDRIFEVTYENLELQNCEDDELESKCIRVTNELEGVSNLSDLIEKLINLTKQITELRKKGFKLTNPVVDGIVSYEL